MAEKGQLVYHYCSLDTFAAILESKVLRLCEVDKSNDSKELLWFREFVERAVVEQFREDFKDTPAAELEASIQLLNGIISSAFDTCFVGYRSMNFLVTCFSKEPDLLSQWRAYSQNGTGVSIGFSKEILVEQIEKLDGEVQKALDADSILKDWRSHGSIQYLDKDTGYKTTEKNLPYLGWIKQQARKIFQSFQSSLPLQPSGPKYKTLSFNTLPLAFNALVHAPYFKNAGFKEEQEWRIGTMVSHTTMPFENTNKQSKHRATLVPHKYFVRDCNIVYYKELCFPVDAIQRVYVGPKCKATPYDLFVLSRLNDIPVDFDSIHLSSVSYR